MIGLRNMRIDREFLIYESRCCRNCGDRIKAIAKRPVVSGRRIAIGTLRDQEYAQPFTVPKTSGKPFVELFDVPFRRYDFPCHGGLLSNLEITLA